MGFEPGYLAGLVVVICAGPVMPPAPKAVDVTVRGRVVTLGAALRSVGLDLRVDPESKSREIVLLGEDRSITPLLRDESARALFLDDRLRDCPTEIHGRRFPGVAYLQVLSFRVERDGRFRTPEYYCNVCSITVPAPQDCPCCQGPMELRMRPERP